MRVVGPGSRSKTPLSAKEIEARVEGELNFLAALKKRGLSQQEEHDRIAELAKFFVRECSKLPPAEAVPMMMKLFQLIGSKP